MEVISEGKNFRLVQEHELHDVMKVLEKHLPYALKVRKFKHKKKQFAFNFIIMGFLFEGPSRMVVWN